MNGRILVRRRNPDREEPPPIFRKTLSLLHSLQRTLSSKTSLSAGASDVSYRLGAALLLKYASLEIHKN